MSEQFTSPMGSPKAKRAPSRPARWGSACAKMREAISELQSLVEEYQDWMDNLPENAQSGPMFDKLETITQLDIDGLESSVEEIEMAELPRGFGKD